MGNGESGNPNLELRNAPVRYDSGLGAEFVTAYRAMSYVWFVYELRTSIVRLLRHQESSFCGRSGWVSVRGEMDNGGKRKGGDVEGLAYLGERKSAGEDGGVVRCGHVVVEHLRLCVITPYKECKIMDVDIRG